MDDRELAYLAGFFDADGSVGVYVQRGTKGGAERCVIRITVGGNRATIAQRVRAMKGVI